MLLIWQKVLIKFSVRSILYKNGAFFKILGPCHRSTECYSFNNGVQGSEFSQSSFRWLWSTVNMRTTDLRSVDWKLKRRRRMLLLSKMNPAGKRIQIKHFQKRKAFMHWPPKTQILFSFSFLVVCATTRSPWLDRAVGLVRTVHQPEAQPLLDGKKLVIEPPSRQLFLHMHNKRSWWSS